MNVKKTKQLSVRCAEGKKWIWARWRTDLQDRRSKVTVALVGIQKEESKERDEKGGRSAPENSGRSKRK